MSGFGSERKMAVGLWVFVSLLSVVEAASSDAQYEGTQCNLRSAYTCHQYWATRRRNMTCHVSEKFSNCDQLCHAGKCNLSCIAPGDCRQRCLAGSCQSMQCTSKKCKQICLRSQCNLKCNSEECVQESNAAGSTMICSPGSKRCVQKCKAGKCLMNCPLGVKYCKQTCIYGNCIMLCKAEICARSCRNGRCIYDSRQQQPRNQVAVIDNCNFGLLNKTCYQECIHGNCDIINYDLHNNHSQICFGGNCKLDCNDNHKCSQVCIGGGCPKLTCTSGVCIQECVTGGCEMECVSAKVCSQICRGGNCTMKCLSHDTKTCQQYCTGGNCKMFCNAEECIPSCSAGYCEYKRKRPPGSGKTQMCDSKESGVCRQSCTSFEGCSLVCNQLDNTHSCNQTCHGGHCNLNCSTKETCNQNCARGTCPLMTCRAKVCQQVCNGGDCGVIECNADKCVQLCFGSYCHMTCPPHVRLCHQACMTRGGQCIFDCHAKQCTFSLI